MSHHLAHRGTLTAPFVALVVLAACTDPSHTTAPSPAARGAHGQPRAVVSTSTPPVSTSGNGVTPVVITAPSGCTQMPGAGAGWRELRVSPLASGTYTNGDVTITLTVHDRYFDWRLDASNTVGVDAVFAKSGSVGTLYRYDPPAESTGDSQLAGPLNRYRSSLEPTVTNAVLFCYDVE